MATLSKNGTELARYVRVMDCDTGVLTITLSVRSNNHVLRKNQIHRWDGTRHEYGWKRFVKLKHGVDMVKVQEYFENGGYERQV